MKNKDLLEFVDSLKHVTFSSPEKEQAFLKGLKILNERGYDKQDKNGLYGKILASYHDALLQISRQYNGTPVDEAKRIALSALQKNDIPEQLVPSLIRKVK